MIDVMQYCIYTVGMNSNSTQQIPDTAALCSFRLPSYEEIPDVGLYLDQTAKYINSYLTDFPQTAITPSMISNYVKLKLVARVHKKTYDRDQIACFFIISLSKTVLPMDHIRKMLHASDAADHSDDYAVFTRCLKNNLNTLIRGSSEGGVSSGSAHEDMLDTVTAAIAHKMLLEWYFEHMEFPQE